MDIININGVEIKIKEFVKSQEENGVMFITDSEVNSKQFSDFVNLYNNYNSKGNYFTVIIDNQEFCGRFGEIVYSQSEESYQMRLVFVESTFDNEENRFPTFVLDRVEYQNMKNKIAKQELIIDSLLSLLVSKEIVSESEVNQFKTFNEVEIKGIKFKMATEVNNIDEYLESINDRLSDIKE